MDSFQPQKKQSKRPFILTALASAVGLFVVWLLFFKPPVPLDPIVKKAVAVLKGDSPVTGTITFEQSSKNGPVKVTGEVNNLDPFSKRGFHIHTLGDITNGCLSSGPHYNPFDRNHGAPYVRERHVGDLGNIQSNRDGVSEVDFYDGSITLNGYLSIVGRTVVVHAGTDDLGQGGNEESLKTGNAGGRAACGIIGLAESD